MLIKTSQALFAIETAQKEKAAFLFHSAAFASGRRNIERFPEDCMFVLTSVEKGELVKNFDWFKTLKHSTVMPYVFTEQGVAQVCLV